MIDGLDFTCTFDVCEGWLETLRTAQHHFFVLLCNSPGLVPAGVLGLTMVFSMFLAEVKVGVSWGGR